MDNNATTLEGDPGRPSKPVLAARFARSEFRAALGRLMRAAGIRKLHDAVPETWQIPDSALAKQAIDAATALCPEFMMRHCFRAWCFGAILAARHQHELDREAFFIAAMLHDLGLSEQHKDDPGSFEWVGASLAHEFCITAEQSEERAALVHNAIALHTSVGIAERHRPEIALLHFGTGMDLFGMRLDEMPKAALDTVLAEYPRGEFKTEFSPCLQHQADKKPDSQIAGAVGIGILDRMLPQLSD